MIGFLSPVPGAEAMPLLIAAFRRGLAGEGYLEGKNLAIEYRFTNFKPELMHQAASDVVRRKVNVIFAANPDAIAAARNATSSIPIVGRRLGERSRCDGICQEPRPPGWQFDGNVS